MNTPTPLLLQTPRPTKFALNHKSDDDDCACEVCWTERAVVAERRLVVSEANRRAKIAMDERNALLEEAKLRVYASDAGQRREWLAEQFSLFRSWTTTVLVIVRLPFMAWVALEALRLALRVNS